MKFTTVNLPLQVRPNDLDISGHVNNATILEYLEAGRWAWLEHHQFTRSQRIIPVVARIEINYRREILPSEVKVITKLEQTDKPRYYQVKFEQSIEIYSEGVATVAADALVKVAFIDAQARTIRTLQDYINDSQFTSQELLLTS